MTKVRQKQERESEEPRPGDYYVIVSQYETWYVSPETAARVGRVLDRRWARPRWVKFVDLSGSRVWLRADHVESVVESTERTRARDRELQYRRRKEERDDRRWDDED
jgi:hypothetical protein